MPARNSTCGACSKMMSTSTHQAGTSQDALKLAAALFIDLDGTLVATDLLWESLFALLKRRPGLALAMPLWVLGGKAAFKDRLSRSVAFPPEALPYRREVLELIRESRAAGVPVVL